MRIKFIQQIIDKIRGKHKKHFHVIELGYKILSYEKLKDNIDMLIFGSSHAQLGYRAKENEFNLGFSFQDLYYSYKLYEKYNNTNIKNVILFYSVFSPGNQTIKTNYAKVASIYKVICGIDYQDETEAKIKNLEKFEYYYGTQYKKYRQKFVLEPNYRGNEVTYLTCYKPPLASQRAEEHFKNNQRNNNQTDYVIKFSELAKNNNAEFLVVIPPMTKAYKNSLPPSKELFKELFDAAKENNLNILNMYDTDIFEDADFEDWDHLSLCGANKLTNIINIKTAEITATTK